MPGRQQGTLWRLKLGVAVKSLKVLRGARDTRRRGCGLMGGGMQRKPAARQGGGTLLGSVAVRVLWRICCGMRYGLLGAKAGGMHAELFRLYGRTDVTARVRPAVATSLDPASCLLLTCTCIATSRRPSRHRRASCRAAAACVLR